ncbi:FtsK/SpoIIIE domain-containing protein [Actinacidiphila sp. DG2A-62]|uniref:FtsK/SpoIIIE domain-containing protein n=1 Tax=Actinacidiphila sp. DG2A-62 TaxID=3108821 RepID=UPI002DB6BF1C|nr:FtsK/SpoIIIE domain-containing protein [Actinacidiphila sp. DG2A-62]MEC3994477.1 FtsK/SpoIIIE domain-containing protein [Actinacidiphila sp. DG2A-62]
MRAYGRRARRSRNAQPLMIVADGSPLVDALAGLVRLAFRYRSELAPLTTALGLEIAAVWLHAAHPAWWRYAPVAVLAVLVTVVRRLDRAEERWYAAVLAVGAGAWLAAAARSGPTRPPLPTLLAVTTAAGAVPWWTHRRRRVRVRVDRTIRAWPGVAEAVGLAGSHVLSAVVDLWGWRARMTLRPGQTVADVVAHVPAIESGLGTRPGAVRVEADPAHAGRFLLRVLAEDPHASAIPWPGASAPSIGAPLDLGVYEDAGSVRVTFLRRHALVGGIAGSGKSGLLNVIVGNLVACPDVVLWGVDLKGGMELGPWASCLDRLATTPAEAAALLHDAVRVVEARARAMSERNARLWEPTRHAPALVIVIDEYAELAENAPAAASSADSVARRGRAVAVTLLAATQRPTQQAMGKGAVRSQMDIRICLRVRERKDTDLVLGQGASAAGWHAHTLDAPGKFLVSAEGLDRPRRARAYLITDDDVRATVLRHAPGRPPLDALSAAALPGDADCAPEPAAEPEDVVDAELVDAPDPELALWAALLDAADEGLTVPDLMTTTGMGRTWIYDRLQAHARADRAHQVARGRWRAAAPHRPPSA